MQRAKELKLRDKFTTLLRIIMYEKPNFGKNILMQ